MGDRHRVFISYHDGRKDPSTGGDLLWRERFEAIFHHHAEVLISGAVQEGDIDPMIRTDTIRQRIRDEYLRNTSVTVVLVGERTWQRKHVDWEIGSSLRHTEFNPRSGLLGILLPSYPGYPRSYNPKTIPPRLHDNVECGFATLHWWSEDPLTVKNWIHQAYLRKNTVLPDNSRDQFARNRIGTHWD